MKLHATFDTPNGKKTIELKDRQGWTLFHLARAGQSGITTIERPALRLAAYVHSLRKHGLSIETEMERHDGPYQGRHARYRLAQSVSVQVLGKGAAL